jgi:purine nucleosidase
VACVARPELVTCREAHVEVELAGRLTSGMTVVDFPGVPNAKVGTDIDLPGFWDLFIDSLQAVPAPRTA